MTAIITEIIGREDIVRIRDYEGDAEVNCPIAINGLSGYVEQIEETTGGKKTLLVKVSGNLFVTAIAVNGEVNSAILAGDKLYVSDISATAITKTSEDGTFIARALEGLASGATGTILVRLCDVQG